MLALAIMAVAAQGAYDEAPHNPSSPYPVFCLDCHSIHEPSYPTLLGKLCDYCHFDGGPAPNVQTHSSRTTDAGYGNWDLDCWSCHNPHTQEQNNAFGTTYGKYIRNVFNAEEIKEIDPNAPGPYYPPLSILRTVTSSDVTFRSQNEFVDGDASATDDICQVCHLSTTNYNSGAALNTHSDYGADSQPGGNCTTCHFHDAGFKGAGSCVSCHSQRQPDPEQYRRQVTGAGGDFERKSHHVTDGTTTEIVTDGDCSVCHDQINHQNNIDPAVLLNDADGGSGYAYGGSGGAITGFCTSCHDNDGANAYGGNPFSDNRTPTDIATGWSAASHAAALTQEGCLSCHGGADATRSETVTDHNAHGSTSPTILSALVDGETVANAAEGLCFACHDADGQAQTDIEAAFSPSPAYSGSSDSGAAIDQVHNPALCNACHNPHLATGDNRVVDPDNPTQLFAATYSPGNTYQGSSYRSAATNYDPVNPAGAVGGGTGDVGPAVADGGNTGNDRALSNVGSNYSGSEDQVYTVEVTTAGQPPTAEITVTSTGSDSSGPTSVPAFGTPVPVGTLGATVTFIEGGGTPSSIGPAVADAANTGDDAGTSGGAFTGGSDLTYTVIVSQGGAPGGSGATYDIGAASCTDVTNNPPCLDDTAVSGGTYSDAGDPGDISYVATVTTSGGSNSAALTITSTGNRDNSGPTTWTNGQPLAVGTRGVTLTISDNSGARSLEVGERWQIDVTQTGGGGGAQITVTSTGGLDDSGPTSVSAFGSPVPVGTQGVTITLTDGGDGVLSLDDIWTIDTTASLPGDGLTAGDRWQIPVTAAVDCTPSCVEPDYVAFCLTCHDGSPPADVAPLMDPLMINVSSAYFSRDQHGNQDGETSRVNKGYKKVPWSTQARYDAGENPLQNYAAMQCTTCHDGHGSASLYHLKTSIEVGGVQLQVGGKAGSQFETIPASTTYELPLIGGTQQDHHWGAWCTFCHEMSNHSGVDESTTCQGGHMHNGGNF